MGVIQVTNSGHDPMSIEYIKIHSGDLSSLDGPPIDENNVLSKRTKRFLVTAIGFYDIISF